MFQRIRDSMSQWINELMIRWTSELMNQFIYESMVRWINKAVNERTNEWIHQWVTFFLSDFFTEQPLCWGTSSLSYFFSEPLSVIHGLTAGWAAAAQTTTQDSQTSLKRESIAFRTYFLWNVRVVGFISQPSTYLMIGVDMMMWILIMTIVANSEVSYLDLLWFIEHSQGDHVNKPFPLQMDLSKHAMYPKLQLRMRKHLTKPCTFHWNFGEKTAKLWGPEHWGNSII